MRYTLLLLLSLLSVAVLAQDKIVTHHDEVINGFVVEISETSVFYSTDSVNENLKRIAKEDILMILKADGTVINLAEAAPATPVAEVAEQPDRFPIVDLSQYHGYLLQKGNCVYIPTDSKKDYERAGQEVFNNRTAEIGYWKVVDKPEQAHFVMIYLVSLSGRDHANICFKTRDAYAKNKEMIRGTNTIDMCLFEYNTDETEETNRIIANQLSSQVEKVFHKYYHDLPSFYKWYAKKGTIMANAWILP